MKNYIKKYLEQVLKGIVTGISIFIGISICVLSINAFDWSGVPTVSSGTALTSSLWNTSMSTITGSIQTLQNTMVALTGDQTIAGTKTFSSPVVGQTPTVNSHLATKGYVDSVASSVPAGAIMSFYLSSCPSGWILADGISSTPDLRGAFVRGMGGDVNGRDVARTLGSYQTDDFKSHSHSISTRYNTGDGGEYNYSNSVPHNNTYISSLTTNLTGGTETRPKNVSLIYCMKQ